MTSRRYLYVGLAIIALCVLAVAVAAFGQTAPPEPVAQPQAVAPAPPLAPTVTLRRFADEPLLLAAPSSKAEQAVLEIADALKRNGCVLQSGIVIGTGDTKRPYVRVVEQAPVPAQVPAGP